MGYIVPVYRVLNQAGVAVVGKDGRAVNPYFSRNGSNDFFAPVAQNIGNGDNPPFYVGTEYGGAFVFVYFAPF